MQSFEIGCRLKIFVKYRIVSFVKLRNQNFVKLRILSFVKLKIKGLACGCEAQKASRPFSFEGHFSVGCRKGRSVQSLEEIGFRLEIFVKYRI